MARITKTIEVRKQEIIDTARKLFIENSFEKTAIADIAREINVAHGLVYHYFKSKTELLYAIIDDIVMEEATNKEKIVSEYEGKASDCIYKLFSNQINFYEDYGKLFKSNNSDRNIIDYAERKMSSLTEPYIITLIKNGNKDGSWDCTYPEDTAKFILYGISGIINRPENIIREITFSLLPVKYED